MQLFRYFFVIKCNLFFLNKIFYHYKGKPDLSATTYYLIISAKVLTFVQARTGTLSFVIIYFRYLIIMFVVMIDVMFVISNGSC